MLFLARYLAREKIAQKNEIAAQADEQFVQSGRAGGMQPHYVWLTVSTGIPFDPNLFEKLSFAMRTFAI